VSIPNEQIPAASGQGQDYSNGFVGAPVNAALESDPNNPPWDIAISIGLWALSVVLTLVVPVMVVTPYLLTRYWGDENAMQAAGTDPTFILLSVLSFIPVHLLTFGAAWAFVTKWGKLPFWRTIRWSWSKKAGLPDYGWMVLGCAGLAAGLYVLGSLFVKWFGGGATDIDILVKSSLATRVTLAVVAATSAPLVEEVLYRGILYPAMHRKLGMFWAVAIVSFLFAFVHVFQYRNNLSVIAVITILSVTLTLVRAHTGRLLPCFLIHLFFNGVQSVLIVLQPYIPQLQDDAQQQKAFMLPVRQLFYALF
jgi:membrane protease YdiL (CAAX protease family)